MNPSEPRLRAALDAAITQIKATTASVAERTAETLAAAAQSSGRIAERDLLNTTQFMLRRNIGAFQAAFGAALSGKVDAELAPREEGKRKLSSADWNTLTLVDDEEVEERMFSDRIGQLIAHECEAEMQDLSAYVAGLLNSVHLPHDRNPLRAELVGAALYTAIESVSDDAETRKLLAREMGRALAQAMPACYAKILADLQARGVAPLVLSVRGVEGPGNQLPGFNSGYQALSSTRSQTGDFDDLSASSGTDALGGYSTRGSRPGSSYSAQAGLGGSTRHPGMTTRSGLPSAHADAQLMALLRRLTAIVSRPGELDPLQRHSGAGYHASTGSPAHGSVFQGGSVPDYRGPAAGPGAAPSYLGALRDSRRERLGEALGEHLGEGPPGMMAVNLIHAHREELVQAATGKLDHMVIDVVGSLFDQILSDSRVPPQMARQIARLQLPVLRVALNDASFFSSRRHPVRRFVNRIASLACAFDEFDAGPGLTFLARVRELVQEIVDGDFDQIELYAAKLDDLEAFIAAQTHAVVEQSGAAATLDSKESELRIQQRYTLQLQGALAPLSLPAYLRDFVSQVWSQALVLAVRRDGPDSDRAQRFRRAGRDLVMSVQPKGSPVLRKKFLMLLPALMKDLNEGMRLVGWPEAAQRDFFGKLLPAHAESLKGAPLSELDHNMMAKQLEAIFQLAVPGAEMLSSTDAVPELSAEAVAQRFSAEETRRVGLVDERTVNWSQEIDIDLDDAESLAEATGGSAPTDLAASLGLGLDINLDFSSAEPAEPTRGAQLVDHIKLGFAYQMHLKDEWQKVRLTHVSSGRGFFVFTHGQKHQETISMTSRMLTRMCETGRLRAVESSYLIERATLRARKQLAALKASSRH